MEITFTETEKLIGNITKVSGSVLLVDGAAQSDIRLSKAESVCLDVDKEQSKLPVYAVKQNNHRFLLIAIDDAIPIEYRTREQIDISEPVDLPPEEPETVDIEEGSR